MELIRYTKHVGLSEISQSMNAKMAILRKNGDALEQVTPCVKCRDFLCDVYSSTLQKQDFGIYGMSWKGSSDTVNWDATRLLLQFPNAKAKEDFNKNLHRLHSIESENGIKLSQVTEITPLEVVVVGSKKWLDSVLSFSLYTLLLRVFCYTLTKEDWISEFGSQSHSDSRYIRDFPRATLDKILGDLNILKMEEWNGLTYQTHGTSGVHHNSGAVSVFSRHTEQSHHTVRQNKHWQHFQKLGLETFIKP